MDMGKLMILGAGTFQVPVMVDEVRGRVWMIEAAVRGLGGFIASHFIPLARGVDVVEQLVELAAGHRDTFDVDKHLLDCRAAGNVYFYLPRGIVRRVVGVEQVRAIDGVHVARLSDAVVGRAVELPTDEPSVCGPIVYSANDRAGCDQIIAEIRRTLKIEVNTVDGIEGIRWT